MRTTPLQQVKSQFGSRQGLVDQLLPLLGDSDDDIRSRLMGTTNKKLLRIYETAKQVGERFGSRKNLVERVLALRYPNGNADDGFIKRVEEAPMKRLLDMYRQEGGK